MGLHCCFDQKTDKSLAAKNAIILHGSPIWDKSGEPDFIPDNVRHWLGWLKEQLTNKGYIVDNPLMPDAWEPDYGKWKQVMDNFEINEETVIIGHSAGAGFAVRWLGDTNKKIKGLVMVAPVKTCQRGSDDRMEPILDFEINKSIVNNIENRVIFMSNDRDYRVEDGEMYAKELDAEMIKRDGVRHFTVGRMGTNKFPELLQTILNFK